MARRNTHGRGQLARVQRGVLAVATVTAMSTVVSGVGAAPAFANVPINTITGTATIEGRGLAAGASGLVMGYGADADAAELVNTFAVNSAGVFETVIPARPSLIDKARANGGVLNLYIGGTRVIETADTGNLVYELNATATAVLNAVNEFDAPDPNTYVYEALEDHADETYLGLPEEEIPNLGGSGVAYANADVSVDLVTAIYQPRAYAMIVDPTNPNDDTSVQLGQAVKTTSYRTAAASSLYETTTPVASMVKLSAQEAAAQAGGGSCVLSGDEIRKRQVIAYPPEKTPSEWSTEGMDIGYTLHAYQSPYARPLVGVGYTWQIEFCNVGGAKVFAGYRLLMVGSGDTSREDKQTLLDARPANGKDQGTISAELYAHVGSETSPVQIGASMTQSTVGINSGAHEVRGPVRDTIMDRYKHNIAWTTWKTVCGAQTPWRNCGSRGYQATINHALWEWPRTDPGPKELPGVYYYHRRCTKFFGNCPD